MKKSKNDKKKKEQNTEQKSRGKKPNEYENFIFE